MSYKVIETEGLGKSYRIGARQTSYKTLRESIIATTKSGVRRLGRCFSRTGQNESAARTFWALQDVALEIAEGEAVGIIGKNGAGKTTLLKILSRITEPTVGWGKIRGRVGSLLEVGTGFHPELTGRENVFLNGAILGMRKTEINSRFDEIVAFAEVDKFIDTPVKHYSSGMYLRLAFSVAAHLDPEILLVDEVLAVGDAAFQQKCLTKMGAVTKENRTVLFVSHNMAAIEAFCNRAILIDQGQVAFEGTPETVIRHYLAHESQTRLASRDLTTHEGRKSNSDPIIRNIRLLNNRGQESAIFNINEDICIELAVDLQGGELQTPIIRFAIENALGTRVCNLFSDKTFAQPFKLDSKAVVRCHWLGCPLVPGTYHIKLAVGHKGMQLDVIDKAIMFEIVDTDLYGTGKCNLGGIIAPRVSWEIANTEIANAV